MPSFANTWNATYLALPADTENISVGASRIRDFKNDLTQRLQVDHSLSGDAYDGTHIQSTLRVSAVDPTLVSGTGIVYTKSVGFGIELFYKDIVGNVVQLTTNGALNTHSFTQVILPRTLTAADSGKIIFTSASGTITLPAPIAGLNYYILGNGNGAVTINITAPASNIYFPDASAASSFTLPLNWFDSIFIYCNGSDWIVYNMNGRTIVSNAVNANEAVALGQADARYAAVVGNAANTFSVANAVTASEAVALGQADARYAAVYGNAANQFYVANAVNANEAVALGQADARYVAAAQSTAGAHMTGNLLNVGRVAGTVYTNTTARVIFVMVGSVTGTGTITGYVNGVIVVTYASNNSTGQLFMPVPPGATYEISVYAINLNNWYELR